MATARAAQGDKRARTAGGKKVSEKVVEEVRVKRHWAGKAPELAGKAVVEDEDEDEGLLGAARGPAPKKSDPRLERLMAEARGRAQPEVLEAGRADEDSDDSDEDTRRARRRRRAAPEVFEEGAAEEEEEEEEERARRVARARRRDDDDDDDEDGDKGGRARGGEEEEEEEEDAIELRRERMKELARQRRLREEEELAAADALEGEEGAEEEEDDDEGSSSYETDSEEEEEHDGGKQMLKPVFVSAEQRETIKEREALEEEERLVVERREARLKERQVESRALLVEAVRKEEMGGGEERAIDFEDMPDDNDEVDELEEFEQWKLRELRRVKREREEAEAEARAAAEIERRRKLTDAERKAEDLEFEKQREGYGQDKAKWKFLQKYYHKGAYFQDEDTTGNNKLGPVMAQDFGQATGKDAVGDKMAMPKVMQVKNFGMRSQVKWTHLQAEDTSSKDSLWHQDAKLHNKANQKLAGNRGAHIFERPSKKQT